MKRIVPIILSALFYSFTFYAQSQDYHFFKLGKPGNGGPEFVNDLLSDSKGRIWIAAQSGFFRYDGEHFLAYKKTKDSTSLIDNAVQDLCEDNHGGIWGGTAAGIFHFDPYKQTFRRYYSPIMQSNQFIENIACDKRGNIWATNYRCLLRLNVKSDSFEIEAEFPFFNSNPGFGIKPNGMLIDKHSSKIWFATGEGIYSYDISAKKWYNYKNMVGIPLFEPSNTGALAVTSKNEFLYFNNYTREIVWFDPDSFKVLKRVSLNKNHPTAVGGAMFEAADGKIWFSSIFNEILVIDPQRNDTVTNIISDPKEPFSLETRFFQGACQDEDGNILLGTPDGVYFTNIGKSLFKLHDLSKVIPELNDHTTFKTFNEDPSDKTWWFTTINNLIIHYYPESGKYETGNTANATPDLKGSLPQFIISLVFYEGQAAITSQQGIWLWQGNGKTLYPLNRFLSVELPLHPVKIAPVRPHQYFMTDGKDVIFWDHTLKSYKRIDWAMGKQTTGGLWGIFPQNRTGLPKYILEGMRAVAELGEDSIRPIHLFDNVRENYIGYLSSPDIDSAGNLWITNTGRGLLKYSPVSKKVTLLDESDGLMSNYIEALAVDKFNNIWTGTKGNFSVWLTGHQKFFNFNIPLKKQNLVYRSFLTTLHNGNIVGNSFNMLLEFFPDRLRQIPVIRLPEISSFYVDDKRIVIASGENLALQPGENNIRILFGLLTNKAIFPYLLSYKLEGIDSDWKTSENNAEAIYNKLPPGDYTFRVKGISSYGTWETGEQVLEFRILKPFYKTVWFLMLMVALLMAIFYAFYRYRLQQHKQIFNLETKTSALEREKATIQYDSLKQQLNPHFLFNSLTSLAGLIEADQEMASSFLQSMSDMYRYILKNGEQETVLLKDELRFAQIYIDIQQTRFGKGLDLSIEVPDEYLHFKIAPVTLQNLIENAIKHNIIDRSAPLHIRIFTEGDYLVVSNNLQKKDKVETSNKTGLVQFASLYKFLSEKPVIIEEDVNYFRVKIPLI